MTQELRQTFNQDADAYDRYRPHYPAALFDSLVTRTHLAPHAELLEIGPGTGQATTVMASRGYAVTGIELGDHLAAKARTVLADYPTVRILTDSFEAADVPADHYDLIYSATAFHWIQESVKFTKTARLLRKHGYLAIIHTEHVSDEHGDRFFHASRPIYKKYEKQSPHVPHLPLARDLKPLPYDEHLFTLVSFERFPLDISYKTADYIGLISTYSPTLSLPPHTRAELLADLSTLIDDEFGGHIDRHFEMTLTILQKK